MLPFGLVAFYRQSILQQLYPLCCHGDVVYLIRFDKEVTGGESIFLDVFAIAEQFRETNPREFETLVRVPATFQKIHFERYLEMIPTVNVIGNILENQWHAELRYGYARIRHRVVFV